MKAFSKLSCAIVALFIVQFTFGQTIREGKISFERKTNLFKKFDDERMRSFLKEENKIKIDKFNLYFNDSISLFSYIAPEEEDEMSWATTKNTVYSNFNSKQRVVFIDMFGTALIINDSTLKKTWKITDRTRKIAGYDCTRAIWQKDDSTRIYAWYTTDIASSVGPESVTGLPGAILGLATEDGGVVYFATKVEIIAPTAEQVTMPKKKGKEFTSAELMTEMSNRMKGQPFGDQVLRELFFW